MDDQSKSGHLERMLMNGKLTIVLIYADWCGACTRFKKSIWGPMSRMPAVHNRIAIREDLVGKTRLAGSKYTYLPTIMVVNEQGKPQAVEGPQGRTNAIPTPRTLDEMKRIVNLKVGPAAAAAEVAEAAVAEPLPTQEPMTMQVAEKPKKTPEGIVYTPYPPALPVIGKQTGGGLLQALEIIANAAAPAAVLGAGVVLGRRSHGRSQGRSTKRKRKSSK